MKTFFLTLALAGAAALPALAQGMMASPDTMACADFTAMDHDGMMGAMADLDAGMSEEEQATAGMKLAEMCKEHPDMMVGEAMGMMDN